MKPRVDPNAVEAIVAGLVQLIAPALARELARYLEGNRGDDLVDRKTAPISKRAWDTYAGKADGFAAFKDGRRIVARRGDVIAWLERTRKITPQALPEADRDEDDAALAAAGVRLRGGR